MPQDSQLIPNTPDQWLDELAAAYASAKAFIQLGEAVDIGISEDNLFHLAPLTCLKRHGVLDAEAEPKATNAALAAYASNIKDARLRAPHMRFIFCYIHALASIGILPEDEVARLMTFFAEHEAEWRKRLPDDASIEQTGRRMVLEAITSVYPPPLRQLLSYGDYSKMKEVPDYVAELGLDASHIPELIVMATDQTLHNCWDDTAEVWSPIHAMLCLGQLQAVEACEPILNMLEEMLKADDEWFISATASMLTRIGAKCIPIVGKHVSNLSKPEDYREMLADVLAEIGKAHPSCRDECVGILRQQLEIPARNGKGANGSIIVALCQLKATEALPAIRDAFGYGVVDEQQVTWSDVKQEFNLPSTEPEPAQRGMTAYRKAKFKATRR